TCRWRRCWRWSGAGRGRARGVSPGVGGRKMTGPEQPNVIEVRRLSKRFGATLALDDVSLAVPPGVVLALVGVNGSGKTTLIKNVLGLLRARAGEVRVFGRDPAGDPSGVLSRIGYLSEDNDLPGWMRLGELLRYTAAFYPGWDWAYAEELCRAFGLQGA